MKTLKLLPKIKQCYTSGTFMVITVGVAKMAAPFEMYTKEVQRSVIRFLSNEILKFILKQGRRMMAHVCDSSKCTNGQLCEGLSQSKKIFKVFIRPDYTALYQFLS